MTEDYRRKLVNWLTSMGMLILITNLCMAAYWFFDRPDVRIRTYDIDGIASAPVDWSIIDWAGPMGELLALYVPGFMVLAIWHLFDLLQRGEPEGGIAARVSSVRTWWIVFSLLGLTFVLWSTGHFSYIAACGGGFVFLWQDCYYTKGVVWIPLIILLLFVPILCMGKAVISIRSLIKKAP